MIDAEYDVALSFAGEDRRYVRQCARELKRNGVSVFYDEFEKSSLWGKDLYAHLHDVYQNKARYCVMFVSQHYVRKQWTTVERKSAQARAFKNAGEYILPARFDDTEIPGLPSTTGYVDLRDTAPKKLAAIIIDKLFRSLALTNVTRVSIHGDKSSGDAKIDDLGEWIVEVSARLAGKYNVHVKCLCPDPSPNNSVAINHLHLQSVLDCLVGNAAEHGGPDTAVTITVVRISVPSNDQRSLLTIEVANDGTPIDPAIAPYLFVNRVSTVASNRDASYGLSHARTLMKAWGGDLILSSNVPVCFTIAIPLCHPDNAANKSVNVRTGNDLLTSGCEPRQGSS